MTDQVRGALAEVSRLWVGITVGFTLSALMGGCLFVLWWQATRDIDAGAEKTAGHDTQLASLTSRFASLCDFLQVDVYDHDVPDDWAEREEQAAAEPTKEQVSMEEQPATQPEIPVTRPSPTPRGPSTEPMTKVIDAAVAQIADDYADDAEMAAFRARLDAEDEAFRARLTAIAEGAEG